MKKILTVLLAAALALCLCAPALADFTARVYNTESLNIRSGPGQAYAWLGSVQKDGQVRVIGESGNWYKIVTLDGSITGYMSKNYLLPVGNNADQLDTYAVVTGTESLNIRSGPGTDYAWLGSAAKGEWVQVTGQSGNWYQVRTVEGNISGYMSKNFLTVWNGQAPGGQGSRAVVQNPAGTRFLNLRESASYTANVLGIFYNGDVCTVLNRQADGWWYVVAEKSGATLYGYFRSEYLSLQGGGSAAGSYTVNTSQNGGNGGKLNLRSRPSTASDSQVFVQVPNGAQVNALLQGGTWWQVEYSGTVGFVDAGFLQGGGAVPPSGTGNAVVQTGNTGKLNLREQANSDARILARFENGTVVSVLQRGTDWCYVQAGGQYGYMMTKFLAISGSASTKVVRNTNGGSYVNLRATPEKTGSNVNVRVPDGATVSLLSWGEEWSRVSYNGTVGYMMSWFLR